VVSETRRNLLLLMGAGSIIALRFAFTAHAAAVSVEVPIDKLADTIGKGVAWIFKRWDTQTIQAQHDSVVTCWQNLPQSWLGEFEQGDEGSFCLTAARMASLPRSTKK
jgi:hypothetical protein